MSTSSRRPQHHDDRPAPSPGPIRVHGAMPMTSPGATPASGPATAPRVMVRRAPEGDDGPPSDCVERYAARAAAVGIDTRPSTAAFRVGLASRAAHLAPSPLILREPIAIGRGTSLHRLVTRRRGPFRSLMAAIAEASPREDRTQRSRSGRLATRRLAPATLALVVFLAGMGQAFAQPRTGLEMSAGASLVRGGPRATAVLRDSLDPLSARVAAGRLMLPTGALTYDVVPGDTLAAIAASHGVAIDDLAIANGITDIDRINAGQRLVIPSAGTAGSEATSAAAAVADAASPAGEAWVSTVGTYVQSRNLSCEYAAAFIATSAFGAGVEEWVFWDQVPAATNPHYGYRGNIDGWWGNTVDYGVYPEALEPVLRANGFAAETFYGMGEAQPLRDRLDRGQPVLVWLGLWGDTAQTLWDDGRYTVAAGAHVVTAYGYDAWGVYVSDPATGTYRSWAWADFLWMWQVLDGMALAIARA